MYDVWKTGKGIPISVDGNGTRKVNVAIYCRVSTEHEEQVKALNNQIEWFNDILPMHPNWNLVNSCCSAQRKRKKEGTDNQLREIKGYYIDEGLSGLSIDRPALNKLIDDCKAGMIDLILTREVCRFSRNLVDSVSLSRELKSREYGVGIFFYLDRIFTYDNDIELKLGIFSTIAQNESEKISERVRSGQKTSRENGVLYGNGNILGYTLIKEKNGNYFEINDEQAQTVKRIFDLYLEGNGVQKIADILVAEKRHNASGEIKWSYTVVSRILHNKTYCGYIRYNVTTSDSCLEHKRHNTNRKEKEYKKAPDKVPPIIDEDAFNECQERMKKHTPEYSQSKTITGKETSAKDVFAKKLRCKCEHSFRRDTWHKNSGEKVTFGYTCYNVLNNGKIKHYTDKADIEKNNICDMKRISELRLRIQALKVFNGLLQDDGLIDEAVNAAGKRKSSNEKMIKSEISRKEKEIEKHRKRIKNYIEMYADGMMDKEQYINQKEESETTISELESSLTDLRQALSIHNNDVDKNALKSMLTEIVDFSDDVDMRIIDKFVYRIIVDSPEHFIWQLHFKAVETENPVFVDLGTYHIDLEYGKAYAKKHNRRLHASRWTDIDVDVQIVA